MIAPPSRLATLLAAACLLEPLGLAGQDPEAGLRARRLEAHPARLTLVVGERAELDVVAYDLDGNALDAPLRVVGPRDALRVRPGGVEALAPGEHEVVATLVLPPDAGGAPLTLRILVTVTLPAVTRLEVAPEEGVRLYEGTTIRYRVRALHANGSERADAHPLWSSGDPRVATVDALGHVTGVSPGRARLSASLEAARETVEVEVLPFPARELRIEGGAPEVRTGDVLPFRVVALDENGRPVPDVPVTWAHSYTPGAGMLGTAATAQLLDGRFVADVPGIHTVVATAGPLAARTSFRVEPRDVVRELDLVGVGRAPTHRTTDFWVFEGLDGRDYAITGSKVADGHAYVFDVTDPANIVRTDSVRVDARTVNDVKVSPDARYATLTREGASDRRNGVVILDLEDPAHPVVASEVTEGLTGGVHNAFPTDTHVFALSNGDKYVIIDVTDIRVPRVVGEYDHPDSRVHDVWVHDGIAYSAEWETGIVAVDVGNGRWGGSPENPALISTYPIPDGATHAVFPYVQPSTGKLYVFAGDERMSRAGLAWAGYRGMGSYQDRYDPESRSGGIPLTTRGYIQVVDFEDPEDPRMVARYEVSEYGTHNIWVEDDVLYQAYYEGGARMVDVSGELMGNLYTQGREIAVFKPVDPEGWVANATMVWSVMPFKGHVFFSDTNSGLWAVKLAEGSRPVS